MKTILGKKLLVGIVAVVMVLTPAVFLTACGRGGNNNNGSDPIPATIILTPNAVTINDSNLTASVTVGGTATGTVTINADALPSGVTASVSGTTINVAGTRPTAQGAEAITGNPVVVVTRGGINENLTVNINLTTNWVDTSTADNAEIANAITTVEGASFGSISLNQVNHNTQATARAVVQAHLNGLNLTANYGVVATITNETHTPAIGGTSGNPAGTNGTFEFTISVARGMGTTQTRTFTVTITATTYTPTIVNAQAPNITTQPQSGSVVVGGTRTATIVANSPDGGTLSFQWYSNATASNAGGTAIGGETLPTFEIPTETAGVFHFYVVITNTNTTVNGNQTASVTSNAITITVNQQHAITVNTTGNGTVTPSTTQAIAGATVNVTVTPDSGYQLVPNSLQFNGNPITGNTFIMPNQAVTITATFEQIPPTQHAITIASMTNGTVAIVGNLTQATQGTTITLSVTPANGFQLVANSLQFNGSPITGNQFVMPNAPITITAQFEVETLQNVVKEVANLQATPTHVVLTPSAEFWAFADQEIQIRVFDNNNDEIARLAWFNNQTITNQGDGTALILFTSFDFDSFGIASTMPINTPLEFRTSIRFTGNAGSAVNRTFNITITNQQNAQLSNVTGLAISNAGVVTWTVPTTGHEAGASIVLTINGTPHTLAVNASPWQIPGNIDEGMTFNASAIFTRTATAQYNFLSSVTPATANRTIIDDTPAQGIPAITNIITQEMFEAMRDNDMLLDNTQWSSLRNAMWTPLIIGLENQGVTWQSAPVPLGILAFHDTDSASGWAANFPLPNYYSRMLNVGDSITFTLLLEIDGQIQMFHFQSTVGAGASLMLIRASAGGFSPVVAGNLVDIISHQATITTVTPRMTHMAVWEHLNFFTPRITQTGNVFTIDALNFSVGVYGGVVWGQGLTTGGIAGDFQSAWNNGVDAIIEEFRRPGLGSGPARNAAAQLLEDKGITTLEEIVLLAYMDLGVGHETAQSTLRGNLSNSLPTVAFGYDAFGALSGDSLQAQVRRIIMQTGSDAVRQAIRDAGLNQWQGNG